MKPILRLLITAVLAVLVGCSTLFPPPVTPGQSEADVIASRGQPTHRYQDGADHLLEYATGPWGRETYMARIGPDGKVISFEQVLTPQKFALIEPGKSTKADVLRIIGAPGLTSYLSWSDLEVWSYPYDENYNWKSMMHVHFDRSGIVRKLLNGPDPRYNGGDGKFP